MHTRSTFRWLVMVTALVLLLSSQAPAQQTEKAPSTAPHADEVLKRMSTYLAAQKDLSFHAEITFDAVDVRGRKLQFAGALDATVKRPNRLYFDYIDDLSAKRFWYDGERMTLLDLDHDVYTTEAAAPDIDAALALADKSFGVSLPLADLILSDPYADMKHPEQTQHWVGLHDVAGVDCDHLAFVDENIDWQIWIEPGERPLPRKLVVTYKTIAGSPQYVAVLSDWSFKAKAGADTFVAKIPETATKTDFLAVEETQ